MLPLTESNTINNPTINPLTTADHIQFSQNDLMTLKKFDKTNYNDEQKNIDDDDVLSPVMMTADTTNPAKKSVSCVSSPYTTNETSKALLSKWYSRELPCLSPRVHAWLSASRISSWVMLVVVLTLTIIIAGEIKPYCRTFDVRDESINEPYVKKQVFPVISLNIMLLLPIFVLFIPVIYFFPTMRPVGHEMNTWALLQCTAFVLAWVVTEYTKLYAGRLRPDFISRLIRLKLLPSDFKPSDAAAFNSTLTANISKLCEDKYLKNRSLRDGRMSFPSGHSSYSFCSLLPVTIFLMSRLRPFHTQSLWRLFVSFIPLILPFLVAMSRTVDHRHHFSDILTGSLIGIATALIATFMYLKYVPASGTWVVRTYYLDYPSVFSLWYSSPPRPQELPSSQEEAEQMQEQMKANETNVKVDEVNSEGSSAYRLDYVTINENSSYPFLK